MFAAMDAATLPDLDQLDSKALKSLIRALHEQVFSHQKQLTTDPDGADFTDTTYDGSGLVWKRSNPHRTSALPTDGTTTFYYDAIGRTCLVVPPDGALPTGTPCASQPSNTVSTSYAGNTTPVTAQAGKSRKSASDAPGPLTQVFEDPADPHY